MKNENTKRRENLNQCIKKIVATKYGDRFYHDMGKCIDEVTSLAEAVVEHHKAAIAEWRKHISEANRQIARRLVNNHKRLSPFVPIRVKVVHSHGDICIRMYRRLYDEETRRPGKYSYEIPFRKNTEKFDWRAMRFALRRTPELVPIFRETEALACRILLLSRDIKKIEGIFRAMDNRVAQLRGDKSLRSKAEFAPGAAAALQARSAIATKEPKPSWHHPSKQRWDF
ncbi:MAG: hypothetical protein ACYC9P_05025 [Rudaea sp.]